VTRVLLIVIALILYGSLFPWTYRPAPAGVSPFSVVLHSWPAVIPTSLYPDIFVNVLLYVPIGLFGFLACERAGWWRLRWVGPLLLAFLLSALVELLQVYDVSRDPSLLDVVTNTIGGALGIGIGYLFRKSMSDSVLLVLLWLGFQVFLLFRLYTGRPTLATRLEQFSIIFAWVVVIYLLAMPTQPVPKNWIPAALATVFMTLVVARQLVPFHWAAARNQFSWIPFYSILNNEWIDGIPVFLEKSFFYAAAIWLIRYAGWSLFRATLLVAALLAITERLQTHLPGRTPEITDPVMAIIFGCVLWLLEQDYLHEHHYSPGM
jgi:VanZ family protein